MARLQKFVGCLLSILSVVVCSSCSSSLEEWVTARGFKYDKNYSTIDKLGYKVVNGVPKPNPSWTFESRQGDTADLYKEENRTIEIKSSGELSKLMKHITDANFSADLNSVERSIITLQRPFTEEAVGLMPSYTGSESGTQKLKIVDRVLNCGKMSIKVYDKNNMNISARINLKGTIDVEGSLYYDGDSNSIISGEGYYVGYDFSEKKLTLGRIHPFKIDSEPNCDKELGILTYLYGVREKPGEPGVYEGLVALTVHPMMDPRAEPPSVKALQMELKLPETVEGVDEHGLSKAAVDLWETATKVEKNRGETPIFKLTSGPEVYNVEMGSKLIVAPSDNVSIMLFVTDIKRIKEGKNVANCSVLVDGQRNILE